MTITPEMLAEAKRFAPEIVTSIAGLITSIAARDMFGAAVHGAALVRQLAKSYDDGGRSFLRHVIRELAEHDVSDALADELSKLENVVKTPPAVS